MKKLALLLAVSTTFVACDQKDRPYNSTTNRQDYEVRTTTTTDEETTAKPRNGFMMGESEADKGISRRVRDAISKDPMAKSVQVSTNNGVVTLSGSVSSSSDRDTVEQKAKAVPGVVRVDNQLKVSGR